MNQPPLCRSPAVLIVGPVLEIATSVIRLKEQIASLYTLLGDRFSEFPKAQDTWHKLAAGEEFQCRMFKRLCESADLQGDLSRLEPLAVSMAALAGRARASKLSLEEAYQISLDLSSVQVEMMALIVEAMEFPHSLEVKNMAAVMSSNLLDLYDMMEKSMLATPLRTVLLQNRAQLIALNLTFLGFDIRNYLTGILCMSRLLLDESRSADMRELLDEVYSQCSAVREAVGKLEKIRLQLTQRQGGRRVSPEEEGNS